MPQAKLEQFFLGIIKTGVYFLMLAPLVFVPTFAFPYVGGKMLYIYALIEIIFSVYLILAVLYPAWRPKRNLILLSLLFFLAILFIASLQGSSFAVSFWGNFERGESLLTWLHFLALFIVLSSVIRTRKEWFRLFVVAIGVALVDSVIVFLEKFGIDIFHGSSWQGASFGNTSFLGSSLATAGFLCLLRLHTTARKKAKIILAVILVILAVALYFIKAYAVSAAFLGSLIMLYGFAIVFLAKKKSPSPPPSPIEGEGKRRRFIIQIQKYLGGVLAALPVIAFLVLFVLIWLPNNPVHDFAHARYEPRFVVWGVASEAIKERPWLGFGLNSFAEVYVRYFDPRIMAVSSEIWFDHAHNIILDKIIQGGVIGFAAYLGIFLSAFFLLWKKFRKDKEFWLPFIVMAFFLAYFIQMLPLFDALIDTLMFIVLLAFTASLAREDISEPKSARAPLSFSKKVASVGVAAFSLACLPFALNYFVILPARASQLVVKCTNDQKLAFMARVEACRDAIEMTQIARPEASILLGRFVNRAADANIKMPKLKNALEIASQELEKSATGFTANPFWTEIVLGDVYTNLARFDRPKVLQAEASYRKAIDIAPRHPFGYSSLGELYFQMGEGKKALAPFQKAVDLAPQTAGAHWILALTAAITGDFELAQNELNLAEEKGYAFWQNLRTIQYYATILDHSKEFERIIKMYEKATEKTSDPTLKAQFQFALGTLYEDLGQKEEAQKAFAAAREIDPKIASSTEDN